MFKTTSVRWLLPVFGGFLLACGGTDNSNPDGATGPTAPTVTGLPSCTQTGVTSDMVYTVMQKNCTFASCHGQGGFPYSVMSAADVKTMLVAPASETTTMPRVTPGQVDKSYVIYKLMGQQSKAAPANMAGGSMPLGSPMLGNNDLCTFVAWIEEGAN